MDILTDAACAFRVQIGEMSVRCEVAQSHVVDAGGGRPLPVVGLRLAVGKSPVEPEMARLLATAIQAAADYAERIRREFVARTHGGTA